MTHNKPLTKGETMIDDFMSALNTLAKSHDGFSYCNAGLQLHNDFTYGYEVGRKYHKVFHNDNGGSRSVVCFVDTETGYVYRADSWKKRGRVIGTIQQFMAEAVAA